MDRTVAIPGVLATFSHGGVRKHVSQHLHDVVLLNLIPYDQSAASDVLHLAEPNTLSVELQSNGLSGLGASLSGFQVNGVLDPPDDEIECIAERQSVFVQQPEIRLGDLAGLQALAQSIDLCCREPHSRDPATKDDWKHFGQLAEEGQDLSRAALEALAIDAYRMDRITGHQLRELLDIPSRDDLDGFLKRHGVPLEYTIDDFEREGETSARLRQKRHGELTNRLS